MASESIQLETACRLGDAFSGQGGSRGKRDLSAQEEWAIFLKAADGGGMWQCAVICPLLKKKKGQSQRVESTRCSLCVSQPLSSLLWLSASTHAHKIAAGRILTAKSWIFKCLEVITVRVLPGPGKARQFELRGAQWYLDHISQEFFLWDSMNVKVVSVSFSSRHWIPHTGHLAWWGALLGWSDKTRTENEISKCFIHCSSKNHFEPGEEYW